jgi:AcrR family transcriptional regulator
MPLQQRAQRTRAALLDVTERLVTEEGPAAVSTTRIAALSGVSVGTIYRYFADREALLLAAYDATVARIVAACKEALDALDPATPPADAARALLGLYLDTAEAVPGHSGLLGAMRAIRPIEADQSDGNETSVVGDLLAPFLEKFAGANAADPARLHFMNVLLGTLVDLYLVTPGAETRGRLRIEIEAHMLLALERAMGPISA